MKRTYFHGTSADNLQAIISNGLSCYTDKIWTCSSNEVYLWGVHELSIANGEEDEDEAMLIDRAFQMASESAQIACSASKDCRLVVLRIELDDSEVMADNSCENMEGSGAVCIGRDIEPSEIMQIKISCDLTLIKGCFISLLLDRDYNNVEFSAIEIKVAEAFKKAELYPEDIDELISWEEKALPKTRKVKMVA